MDRGGVKGRLQMTVEEMHIALVLSDQAGHLVCIPGSSRAMDAVVILSRNEGACLS